MSPVTVLSHLGDADAIGLPSDLRRRVEVMRVSGRTPPGPDLSGEVLFTLAHRVDTLEALLGCGVRWVHLAGTGIDKFPVEVVPDDIALTNSRGASAVPISEWTLAVMLAHEKRLPESWVHEPVDDVTRFSGPPLGSLHGRTLALLGLGGIGRAIAERALPFGMRVRALRRTERPSPVPGVEVVGTITELVAGADHLVIAAPHTPETDRLLGDEVFRSMKPGVHLVNIARGRIVDENALRRALDDGTVARASLDAVDPEPLPSGHWLYEHPSVRVSPHISWSSPDAFTVMHQHFTDNLRRYLDGEELAGVVDREARY
jgi:phosphoglycerate dehydrogenase-like enzyme